MTSMAEDLAADYHRERVAETLKRTDGEVIHPDHFDLRQGLRDAVLEAMDQKAVEHGKARVMDRDLPFLFQAIDVIAERLFLRNLGYDI